MNDRYVQNWEIVVQNERKRKKVPDKDPPKLTKCSKQKWDRKSNNRGKNHTQSQSTNVEILPKFQFSNFPKIKF